MRVEFAVAEDEGAPPLEPQGRHVRTSSFRVRAETRNGRIVTLKRDCRSREAAEDHRVILAQWRRVWVEEIAPKSSPAPKVRVSVERERLKLTASTICTIVGSYFGIPSLVGRSLRISRARHIAMYFTYRFTSESLLEIGAAFGTDHSSVSYARDKIAAHRLVDEELQRDLFELEEMLRQDPAGAAQ